LAPGSHLVLSHVADLGNREQPDSPHTPARAAATRHAAQVYESLAGPFTLRTAPQIEALFDGFELLPPGVLPAHEWHTDRRRPTREVPILAGVGRLPQGLGRAR
jgi:hypothetical protein